MSSKTSKDKYDTISIDTTILKINVKSTGDLITKEYDLIPFHPNMADLRDLSNNSYILFPSFVKITMKDLQKAELGSDYPKIFMDLDKYIKLIKYVTKPDKEEDYTLLIDRTQVKNYTIALAQNTLTDLLADNVSDILAIQKTEPLTEEEIITNNIELIKSLFFPLKGRFFILGNEYVIGQSKYIPPYIPSAEINDTLSKETTKKIPLAYTAKIELQLLDAINNPDAGDFGKMSCKAKKGNIAKDMKDIFGTNFGYIPEQKIVTPSILNTSNATKNRPFGKIQKEWEERNKYIKAPTNDRERKEMENKWTPLQKKMADYDKNQEAYNKIPPLWLKETDALDKKYLDLKTELLNYWKEMAEIHESNRDDSLFKKDQLDAVKTKINTAIQQLHKPKEEIANVEQINTFITAIEQYKNTRDEKKAEQVINEAIDIEKRFLFTFKSEEQKTIDETYVKGLTTDAGLEEKTKDIEALQTKEAELITQRSTSDPYEAASINAEIAKVQAELRKKKAEKEVIEQKYKDITTKWKEIRKTMKSLTQTIENEKTKVEKELTIKTDKEELTKKMTLIKKKEDLYLIASVKEGINEEKTSKTEKESLDKKDRPLDNATTIEEEIKNMKIEYLDIAGKRGFFYRIQAEIVFLTENMKRLKDVIQKGYEDEKKKLDDKIKDIDRTISNITDKQGKITDEPRYDNLKRDQAKIQEELDKKNFTEKINKVKRKVKLYEEYIKKIKGISDDSQAKPNFEAKYTEFFAINKANLVKIEDRITEGKLDNLFEGDAKEEMNKTPYLKELGEEYLKLLESKKNLEKTDITDKVKKEQSIKKKDKEIDTKKEEIEGIATDIESIEKEINLKAGQTGGENFTRTRKHSRKYRHKKTKRALLLKRNKTLRKWRRVKKYLRKKKRTLRTRY
jgi:hypothetical protein